MRRLAAVLAALLALWTTTRGQAARAEFDWPVTLSVPDMDVAVGVTGGVSFGEDGRARSTGALIGVDVSLLHGVFGVHGGLRVHGEGYSWRVEGMVETTFWYLVMAGVGVKVGGMVEDGGPNVPDTAVTLTAFLGLPIPVWRLNDGEDGTLVIVPYARPGLRILAEDDIVGHHEAGVMLKWTSFGF